MAADDSLGATKTENEITGESEKPAPKELYTLEVLRLVKDAQLQHGLRHDDYQRYRQYCARRIRRTRKALHFPQGTKHKVQPKKLTKELVKDARFLMLPLIDAERAWAYAMQLKSEANTEPRKRFHMINRLRKAVQHANMLDRLCNETGLFDARTKLEVEAYSSWMKGLFDFELESWRPAMDNFAKAKTIYAKLAEAVSDEAKDLYQQRCSELSPNIRYCEYNIGDESAAEDLMQMRRQIGHEDPLSSRLDELLEKTRERQSARLSEISWAGRTVPVKNDQVRVLLVSIEQNAAELAEMTSDEHKVSLYESMLKALVEAQQILRDDHKDDPAFKSLVRGQQSSDDVVVPNSVYLHTYIIYLRQTYTVERNLLMIEMLRASKQGDGKKNRPQDFARLYEIIVQSLSDIIHLPGFEDQMSLSQDINSRILCYKAFKCYFIAQSYLSVKKYKEVLALYERVLDYAQQSLETHKSNEHHDKSREVEALQELMKTVDGSKYSVHASSILESHDMSEPAAASSAAASSKPLEDRLYEYMEDPTLLTKRPNLTKFPPDFEPIPAKPLFFDLALNLVQFPSLEDKVEQKPQASGIAGFFKGWWSGGAKK